MNGLTSAEWGNFLDNSVNHVWRTANVPWIRELFGLPFLKSEKLFREYLKLRFYLPKKPLCLPVNTL